MADAGRRVGQRVRSEQGLQVGELAGLLPDLQLTAGDHRDAGRVVAAVLQPPQPLDHDLQGLLRPHIAHDSTHDPRLTHDAGPPCGRDAGHPCAAAPRCPRAPILGRVSQHSSTTAPETDSAAAGDLGLDARPSGLDHSSRGALVALVIGWTALVDWPGFYRNDTINMIWQTTGALWRHDWHSPLLRDLYGVLTPVATRSGCSPHSSPCWESSFGSAPRCRPATAWCFVVLLMVPPTVAMLGFVGKDTQLMLAMVGMGTLLFAVDARRPTATQVAGIVGFCALQIIVRPNAVLLALAAAPVIGAVPLGAAARVAGRIGGRQALAGDCRRRGGAGGADGGANRPRPPAGRRADADSVGAAGWDVVAVSLAQQRNLLPAAVTGDDPCSLTQLAGQYSTVTSGPLALAPDRCVRIALPHQGAPPTAADLSRQISLSDWLSAVLTDPLAYARHRAAVTAQIAGIAPTLNNPFYDSSSRLATTIGIDPAVTAPAHGVIERLNDTRSGAWSLMWRPWVWALLATIGVAVLAFGRSARVAWWLAASVLAYTASMAVVAPSGDLRYLYPIWGLVLLTAPRAIAQLWQRRGTRHPKPAS